MVLRLFFGLAASFTTLRSIITIGDGSSLQCNLSQSVSKSEEDKGVVYQNTFRFDLVVDPLISTASWVCVDDFVAYRRTFRSDHDDVRSLMASLFGTSLNESTYCCPSCVLSIASFFLPV